MLDGIDVSTISLRQLRLHISLIPQEPVFFTSSLRLNLDPFNRYSDEDIWLALSHVNMMEEIKQHPIGLQMQVTEGGASFSVGQRQLLCLARALLQKCQLLLIDEATANVDNDTDLLVQKMIRDNFKHCTILTIAHRLDTIVDSDTVLVFDQGELVEQGSPAELIHNNQSKFYKLASESGDSELSKLTRLANENRNKFYRLNSIN
ncbi:hypothetical protein GJ496_005358 [Pomphorhynchus laevis]|nr:hypothetical protein GJ496_005358 [Pomphorhynchus laevis]